MNKLYETNSYLKECSSIVTGFEEREGEFFITLSDTIFFPEEGGQYADTGVIKTKNGDFALLDGHITVDKSGNDEDVIEYKVSGRIEPGCEVTCILDYEKRFDRMQNHSGEHILTGVIHKTYGFDNVGFHLSDDGPVTLDINGVLSYEQVLEMEKAANQVIYRNLPIVCSYPSKEELKNLEYRSKIDIPGQVRLVSVGSGEDLIDTCACCAPHVSNAGEVGIIKVTSVVNWKGGVRIAMLAGRRALEYINGMQDVIRELTGILTTSPEKIAGMVRKHIDNELEIKLQLNKLNETMILDRISAIPEADRSDNHIEFVDSDFPQPVMKNIYNEMAALFDGYVGIFAGDDENGYRYLAGTANGDSRILATELREKLNAKGGGKQEMIQGQVNATKSEIEAILMGM